MNWWWIYNDSNTWAPLISEFPFIKSIFAKKVAHKIGSLDPTLRLQETVDRLMVERMEYKPQT